jgi:hypothetical protein
MLLCSEALQLFPDSFELHFSFAVRLVGHDQQLDLLEAKSHLEKVRVRIKKLVVNYDPGKSDCVGLPNSFLNSFILQFE